MFAHLSSQWDLLSWRGAPESLEAEVLAISAYTLRCVALHWDNYCFRKLDSVGFAFLHWLDFVWVWNCTECRGRGSWSSALCPGNRNKSSVEHSLHFHIIAHGLHSRLFSLSQSIGLSVYLFTCKDSMSHFLSLPSFFFFFFFKQMMGKTSAWVHFHLCKSRNRTQLISDHLSHQA